MKKVTIIPETKDVVRVTYQYKNGDKYHLEGDMAKLFFAQVNSASIMGIVHGAKYEALTWLYEKFHNNGVTDRTMFTQQEIDHLEKGCKLIENLQCPGCKRKLIKVDEHTYKCKCMPGVLISIG